MAPKKEGDIERALTAFGAPMMSYQSFGPDSPQAAIADPADTDSDGPAFPLLAAALAPARAPAVTAPPAPRRPVVEAAPPARPQRIEPPPLNAIAVRAAPEQVREDSSPWMPLGRPAPAAPSPQDAPIATPAAAARPIFPPPAAPAELPRPALVPQAPAEVGNTVDLGRMFQILTGAPAAPSRAESVNGLQDVFRRL